MHHIMSGLLETIGLYYSDSDSEQYDESRWNSSVESPDEPEEDLSAEDPWETEFNDVESSRPPSPTAGFFPVSSLESPPAFLSASQRLSTPTTDFGRSNSLELIILDLKGFRGVTQVVQALRDRKIVVINLNQIHAEEGQRALDFLAGSICISDGSVERVGHNTFLLAPHFVKITGEDVAPQSTPSETPGDTQKTWSQAS